MLSLAANYLDHSKQIALWEELGAGAPTLVAFARLCSAALAANQREPVEELTEEARAILYAARNRGAIEVKGINSAVDSTERFLAICIELDAERTIVLKRRDDPEQTVKFLDGFRQLCASGLVMHHIFRDFSLTRAGFDLARQIQSHEVPLLRTLADEQLLEEF